MNNRTILLLFILLTITPTYLSADTEVSGIINTSTTWTAANSPYIVTGSIMVNQGVELTVEPGVTAKFYEGAALQVAGTLSARGTEAEPVKFTSNGASPASGDWNGIYLMESSADAAFDQDENYTGGCILEHCEVRYAGVDVDDCLPYVKNTIITDAAGTGLNIDDIPGSMKVIDCIVNNNGGVGIYVNSGNSSVLISSCTVDYNGNRGIFANCLYMGEVHVQHCMIRWNSSTGIVAAGTGGDGEIVTITDCWIEGNSWYAVCGYTTPEIHITRSYIIGNKGAITAGGPGTIIRNNVIAGNEGNQEQVVRTHAGESLGDVRNNSIVLNDAGSISSFVKGLDSCDFCENTITQNRSAADGSTGIVLGGSWDGTLQAENNNWFNNISTYAVSTDQAVGNPAIVAENNWWGTTDYAVIKELIYDWYEDSSKAIVYCTPYLLEPSTVAPVSPPYNLEKEDNGAGVQLKWDPNPEGDIAGYRVYYSLTGSYEFADCIDVGNTTGYVIPGAAIGNSYAVTAYDNDADGIDDQIEGHESWYNVSGAARVIPEEPPDVPGPAISLTRTTLDFAEVPKWGFRVLTFSINNAGPGTLYGRITPDRGWITTDKPEFIGNDTEVNVIVYNNDLVDEQEYAGYVNITSNGGDASVLVTMLATCVFTKPNPYNPNAGDLTFFGIGVPGAEIKIYTLAGELVSTISAPAADTEVTWDGNNGEGEPVLSGVYLYTTENTLEKNACSFTIIRQ